MIGSALIVQAMMQSNAIAERNAQILGRPVTGDELLIEAGVDVQAVRAEVQLALPQYRPLTFEQAVSAAYMSGLEVGIRAARLEAAAGEGPSGDGLIVRIVR